jgi:nucleoside-diphosphate-sugar epimerase
MNILVTGATGLVGNLIARWLAFEDHHVHALVRDRTRAIHVANVVAEVVIGDLTIPSTLKGAMDGIDTVIHCAGLVGSGRGDAENYFRINTEGTRALVDASKAAGVKRFVFMSTAGVYGLNMLKGNVDETMSLRKSNGYTNSKIAAEEIVRTSGMEFVILRPYWITGGGDRFLIPTVARMILNNTFTYLGDGQQQWSISAVENVSAAVATAATHPKAGNQIYNVADATVKVSETVNVIAKALGMPAPTKQSSALGIGINTFLHMSPDDPNFIMSIDLFFPLWRTMTLNAEKIRKELGWGPKISWQDSVTTGTVEWKRKNIK